MRYFLIFLLSIHTSVFALGPRGHMIVADLAAAQLTPEAKRRVEELLDDNARDALITASNWADEARVKRNNLNGRYHYVNFPRGQCQYRKERDCAAGDCVVDALTKFVATLSNKSLEKSRRANALRWVVHLVADIHQPFHAGFADDAGGNRVQVRLSKAGTNLHALWDHALIGRRGLKASGYARWLEQNQKLNGDVAWSNEHAAHWAENSCEILVRQGYPKSKNLDEDYLSASQAVIESQMRLAGARLAHILNTSLASKP